MCVFENYRWSEDLDFDWAGSAKKFKALVDAALLRLNSRDRIHWESVRMW